MLSRAIAVKEIDFVLCSSIWKKLADSRDVIGNLRLARKYYQSGPVLGSSSRETTKIGILKQYGPDKLIPKVYALDRAAKKLNLPVGPKGNSNGVSRAIEINIMLAM